MRLLPSTACLTLLAGLSACSTAPVDPDAPRTPRSIVVVCAPGRLDVECFRPASELCGRTGYDLFDSRGQRATVADAQFGALEARCRQ